MTLNLVQSDSLPLHVVLRDRCAQLALPTWRFSAGGHVIAPPTDAGPVGQWLRSRVIDRMIERQVEQWLSSEDDPQPAELFEGCWLIPLLETHRRRRRAITVAMVLSREALETEQFLAACQSASLDAESTGTALLSIAVHSPTEVTRLNTMLGWLQEDLRKLHDNEHAVTVFSRQLAESYEEVSLLYKLGQSMNQLVHPQRYMHLACEELHATMPFGWVAARFVQDRTAARALAGQTFFCGDLPCQQEEFDRVLEAIALRMPDDQRIADNHHPEGKLGEEPAQVLVQPILREGVRVGVLCAGDKYGEDRDITTIDMKMLDAAAGYMSVLLQNAKLYDDHQAMFLGTLQALTASIDAKDPYTRGHSERVAHLASQLALAMGQSHEQAERVRIGGLVHDIGKIGVPESVLCKPGKLTDEEFGMIRKHPEIGYEILRDIPLMDDVLPGVKYHHERWDGRGYPCSLKGLDIPLIARVIGLADAFDAMSSNRTYRPALPREKVLEELRNSAERQFDPELVPVFVNLDFSVFDAMVARHQASSDAGDDRFGRVSKKGAA